MLAFRLHDEWSDIPIKHQYNYLHDKIYYDHEYAVVKLIQATHRKQWKALQKHSNKAEVDHIVYQLVQHYQYLLEASTTPLLSQYYSGGVWYYFPTPDMEYSSYNEYMHADRYYTAMITDTDNAEYHARRLLATLARPISYTNRPDNRAEVAHESEIKAAAYKMKNIDEVMLYIAITFFSACKDMVHERYGKWLFPKGGGDGISPDINLGWLGMQMSVAKSGAFGNDINQVGRASFHGVCSYLCNEISQAKAIAAAQKEASKGN